MGGVKFEASIGAGVSEKVLDVLGDETSDALREIVRREEVEKAVEVKKKFGNTATVSIEIKGEDLNTLLATLELVYMAVEKSLAIGKEMTTLKGETTLSVDVLSDLNEQEETHLNEILDLSKYLVKDIVDKKDERILLDRVSGARERLEKELEQLTNKKND